VFNYHLWVVDYSWHPHFFERHWAAMEAACNTPNNFNKFGGVTTLQDNNKTQAIEI
jgi:hypothetical protein